MTRKQQGKSATIHELKDIDPKREGMMNENRKGNLTIHFNDGTNMSLSFQRSADATVQYNIGEIIKKAFDARQLILEMEDRTLVFPFSSIKYIQVKPSPKILPKYAIRGVEIVNG